MEEVIFLVPSVCVSVCLHSAGPTELKFGTCIKDHHILDEFEAQRSRSPIPVFSLVSKNVVTGVRVTKVKVVGQGQTCMGAFVPDRLAGGATCGCFHFTETSVIPVPI